MRFRVTLAVAAVGVASLAPHAAALPSSQIISEVDLGQGAAEAWVYLPEGAPECAVVFLHGAGDLTPGPYRAWLSYLAIGKRCAVIYPRYQATASALSTASLRGLRAGVAASFAYLRTARFGLYRDPIPKHFPVVVAGFASGGVLALYAAANAKRWGVPVPNAVDGIFPVDGRIPGVPLAPLAAGTRVLIQAGDRDKAGGQAAARSLWQSLASHPAGHKRLQVVHSTAGFAAVHNAPLQATTTAASIFWDPLDTFIDAATGG
jgi:hypothetical protein